MTDLSAKTRTLISRWRREVREFDLAWQAFFKRDTPENAAKYREMSGAVKGTALTLVHVLDDAGLLPKDQSS